MFSYNLYRQFIKLALVWWSNGPNGITLKMLNSHENIIVNKNSVTGNFYIQHLFLVFSNQWILWILSSYNVWINKVEPIFKIDINKFTFVVTTYRRYSKYWDLLYYVGVTREEKMLTFIIIFRSFYAAVPRIRCLAATHKHQQNLLNCNNKRQFDGNMEI